MAASTIGRLEPFDPGNELIVVYLERMQLFFEANEIKAEKQVPVFLTIIGRENYVLLRNLTAPEKPSQKSLSDLKEILKKHFEPKPQTVGTVASRFQFHQRQQQPGETAAMFLAELRKMAVPCEFGNALDESLRDRLVCGLANAAHQKRLLSEGELSLDKALLIAQSLEMAEGSTSADILVGPSEVPVVPDTEDPRGQPTGVSETGPGTWSTPVVSTGSNTSRRCSQRQRKPNKRYMNN